MRLPIISTFSLFVAVLNTQAGVPSRINHQGVVSINSVRFTGTGEFHFALVGSNGLNLWTNDGSQLGTTAASSTAVMLPVINGIYFAELGSTDAPYSMVPIPGMLFENDMVDLRIWFAEPGQLPVALPSQALTTVPYAFNSEAAELLAAPSAPNVSAQPTAVDGIRIDRSDPGRLLAAETSGTEGHMTLRDSAGRGIDLRTNNGGSVTAIWMHNNLGGITPSYEITADGRGMRFRPVGGIGRMVIDEVSKGIGFGPDGTWTLVCAGDIVASGNCCVSDKRYKTDIARLTNALSRIRQMRGVNFKWNRKQFPQRKFPEDMQVGFVAQELAATLPEAVRQDPNGFLAIDYGKVAPVLVEGVKALDAAINDLQAQNTEQAATIAKQQSELNARDELLRSLEERLAAIEHRLKKNSTLGYETRPPSQP
jgi:hypothetical protein